MYRVYVSKVVPANGLLQAVEPAIYQLIPGVSTHGITESDRWGFWVGQADTTDAQHQDLVTNHLDQVISIDTTYWNTPYVDLDLTQQAKAAGLMPWLGLPARQIPDWFTVSDLVTYLLGLSAWSALPISADL